ncbi:MAG: hypothetical protein LBF21_00010 [Puniceicoccales bacterium]|nr:hypothetical protein [Puniceicoccales bacterium]
MGIPTGKIRKSDPLRELRKQPKQRQLIPILEREPAHKGILKELFPKPAVLVGLFDGQDGSLLK